MDSVAAGEAACFESDWCRFGGEGLCEVAIFGQPISHLLVKMTYVTELRLYRVYPHNHLYAFVDYTGQYPRHKKIQNEQYMYDAEVAQRSMKLKTKASPA